MNTQQAEDRFQTQAECYAALTSHNQRQLDYLAKLEGRETWTRGYQFDISCRCGGGGTFTSVEGARSFIMNHAGHSIWIDTTKRRW